MGHGVHKWLMKVFNNHFRWKIEVLFHFVQNDFVRLLVSALVLYNSNLKEKKPKDSITQPFKSSSFGSNRPVTELCYMLILARPTHMVDTMLICTLSNTTPGTFYSIYEGLYHLFAVKYFVGLLVNNDCKHEYQLLWTTVLLLYIGWTRLLHYHDQGEVLSITVFFKIKHEVFVELSSF